MARARKETVTAQALMVEISQLGRRLGRFRAVDDLEMTMQAGEIFGLIELHSLTTRQR